MFILIMLLFYFAGFCTKEIVSMKFGFSRIWSESTDYSNNRFFSMTGLVSRRASKNTSAKIHPVFLSLVTPEPRCSELTAHTASKRDRERLFSEVCNLQGAMEIVYTRFRGAAKERNTYNPNKIDLNDPIRDLGLIFWP